MADFFRRAMASEDTMTEFAIHIRVIAFTPDLFHKAKIVPGKTAVSDPDYAVRIY